MNEPKVARDAEERGESICRTCLAPIWNEGGTIGRQKRDSGWSDRIERGGDSLVCFKAREYRHIPLAGREAEIYDLALARGAGMDGEAFDRLIDARVRARVVAEEPEWEYGLTWEPDFTGFDEPQSYSGCETESGAWEAGRSLAGETQSVRVWKRPMRPAVQSVPAGPWVPVKQEDQTTKHETGDHDADRA